jgi:hypothetical protein
MRTLRLARVAAEAEGLRLRTMAQRMVTRILVGLVALVFLAGVLVFVHVAIWYWLRLDFGWNQISTAAILGGGDLVIAAVLGLMAARSSPGRIEREALELRRRAWISARSTLAISAALTPALRLGLRYMRRRR